MSETFNPILAVEKFQWRLFKPRPVADASTEIVLTGEGTPMIMRVGRQEVGNSDLRLGRYTQLHRVDVAERSISFTCDIPSRNPAIVFHTKVRVFCSVTDPLSIVQRNIRDVRAHLEPAMIDLLRQEGSRHDVSHLFAAEAAMKEALAIRLTNQRVNAEGKSEFPFGFSNPTVTLTIDQAVATSIRQKATATFGHEVDRQAVDHAHDLDRLRESREQERILQSTQHQLVLEKLKMDFYTPIIAQGNFALLGLYLSTQSQDVAMVAEKLMHQQQTEFRMRMDMLRLFVDEDALEGAQLADPARKALKQLLMMLESGGPANDGRGFSADATPAGNSYPEPKMLTPNLGGPPQEDDEKIDLIHED
jgi:hypothetical protein